MRTQAAATSKRSARPLVTSQQLLDDDERGYAQPIDMMESNVQDMTRVGLEDAVSGFKFEQLAEYEKFMNDAVVIQIFETTDVNAPRAVFIGVNGDSRWLPRGVPLRLQRKFVERLAQAQEMAFTTVANRDQESDNGFNVLRKVAQSYQFAVLEDKHPLGRKWLTSVMRQGS